MMIEINVEEIMEEIRKDILEKGYTNDMLSFEDVKVQESTIDGVRFQMQEMERELSAVNSNYELHFYREYEGNFIKKLIKKVIRKIIKPIIFPICEEQIRYNVAVTRVLNQMNLYIHDLEKGKKELADELETLYVENEKIKSLLEKK